MTEKEAGTHTGAYDNSGPHGADDRLAGDVRRRAHRKRTLKAGYAVFGDSCISVPCLIRDISDLGARIRFESLEATPSRFELHIEIDGIKIPCEKVWTKGLECGVHFTGDPQKMRVLRNQVLGTSENALSASWITSGTSNEAGESKDTPRAGATRSASATRTFGRRG